MKSLTLMVIVIFVSGIIFSDDVIGMGQKEPEGESMMMKSDTMMMSESMPPTGGGKIEFTTLEHAMGIAATGPAVLFFYADWCPACRTALRDIDVNSDQLGDITVFIVNYDKEKDLKKKYGVTYQHTFVQIDESGEKTALWSGGGVKEIVKNSITPGEK